MEHHYTPVLKQTGLPGFILWDTYSPLVFLRAYVSRAMGCMFIPSGELETQLPATLIEDFLCRVPIDLG